MTDLSSQIAVVKLTQPSGRLASVNNGPYAVVLSGQPT